MVLTFGLVCLAVGLIQSPPTLTAEAQASVSVSSLDSLGTSDQPAVKTRPIESLRVGDRVLAKNPEVSNSERRSWGEEPDWSTWKKLSVEMPKEDGTTLHVEIIRPVEWLESQVGFVVAEREEPVCHIGPELAFGHGEGERVGCWAQARRIVGEKRWMGGAIHDVGWKRWIDGAIHDIGGNGLVRAVLSDSDQKKR